jgi:hypothetical protein
MHHRVVFAEFFGGLTRFVHLERTRKIRQTHLGDARERGNTNRKQHATSAQMTR